MPEPVDLATFKPGSPGELLEAILSHVLPALGDQATQGLAALRTHLESFANEGYAAAKDLAEGRISAQEADFLLHMQEAYLNNILHLAAFIPYAMAQAVLDAALKVVTAGIRNWTGISLDF